MTHVGAHGAHARWLAGAPDRSRTAFLVAICVLILSGCASGTTALRSPAPTASSTAAPVVTAITGVLPHFTDWRAAYLAPDGRAHVVTLDGKTDLAGPLLPDLRTNGMSIASAGVGPDDKTLAYSAGSQLKIVDLTGQAPPPEFEIQNAFNDLLWSPDQSKLYSLMGGGQFFYVTLATGKATIVTPGGEVNELGWIDNTHLAALNYQGASSVSDGGTVKLPTSAKLVSLDVTNKQMRTITTVHSAGLADFRFVISPDRSQALYYDAQYQSDPFIPQVALINLKTGHVTPLPAITKATGANYAAVVWRPGTDTIAVSRDTPSGIVGLDTWVLNVAADTATPIALSGNLMGWAPNNGPLIASSGYQSAVGDGPNTLTAVTCASSRKCSATILTTQAIDFTFLGFVRNP